MPESTHPSWPLNEAGLKHLSGEIQIPRYERKDLILSIAHIGVGGFHRAHQAVYLDDLLTTGATQWGECGIGLLPQDRGMLQALTPQDHLYTVLTRDQNVQSARVIGSIGDYLFAPEQQEDTLGRLASEATKIVSLTITEGGYYLDERTGELNSDHPDIRHDLEPRTAPCAVLGYLAQALQRRKAKGLLPFTVLSCDNLPGNGNVIRKALLSFADLYDRDLGHWIEQYGAFPNSMVDGITPTTTDADREALRERFRIEDRWPVVTEPFRQWVMEDHFPGGRPPWEEAGVQFTYDVQPYELMKLRLLNAGHSALGYLGALRGFRYVHQAAADPDLQAFLQGFFQQVEPVVPQPTGVDLRSYETSLVKRFSNDTIRDQISRICSEGSSKIPKFLLPSYRELQADKLPHKFISCVVAAWWIHLRGRNEEGGQIEVIDHEGKLLTKLGHEHVPFRDGIKQLQNIFGNLAYDEAFIAEVEHFTKQLSEGGVKHTVHTILEDRTYSD